MDSTEDARDNNVAHAILGRHLQSLVGFCKAGLTGYGIKYWDVAIQSLGGGKGYELPMGGGLQHQRQNGCSGFVTSVESSRPIGLLGRQKVQKVWVH